MTGVLIGALGCSRCGASIRPGARFCLRCGMRSESAADASAAAAGNLLNRTVPAGKGRRRAALLIDVLPSVVLALASLVVAVGGTADPAPHTSGIVITGLTLAALYILANLWALGSHGRSAGRLLIGLRTVDELTATPVSVAGLGKRILSRSWPGGTATLFLREGRDPVSLAYAPLAAEALVAAANDRPVGTDTSTRGTIEDATLVLPERAVTVIFDSGQRHNLTVPLLIGRNPERPPGTAGFAVFALADLSRTLSKTHALLEWDGRELWVTDLQSTNGTMLIRPDGTSSPLTPGDRTPVSPDWTVAPGDRTLTFLTREPVMT